MKKVYALALAVGLGCSGDSTGPETPELSLDAVTVDLSVGQKRTIIASAGDGAAPQLTWRSTLPTVATVSATGEVTALAAGQTMITAMLVQDTLVKASALVRVTASGFPVSIPVLGSGAVTERYTAEVAARGDWAYTTTWSNRGFGPGNVVKIWNVAGNTPVLRDSIVVTGGVSTIGDVQISDDGALLAIATEGFGSMRLYDRADPSKPVFLSVFNNTNTTRGVHTLKLSRINGRHYAFLSINPTGLTARLVIVDITTPTAPVEVWTGQMGDPYVHDVHVRDGLLFTALWHDGMSIFDIGGGNRGGSPSNPVLISNIPTVSGYIHNIHWFHNPQDGSKKYVILGEEGPGSVNGGTASGDVHIIDISDINQPKQVAQYSVDGAGTHNFAMDEQSGILYAAYYNGGVRALDLRGDLGACAANQKTIDGFCNLRPMGREVGSALTTGAFVWGVALQGNNLYASDMRAGIYKLDVSALKRP